MGRVSFMKRVKEITGMLPFGITSKVFLVAIIAIGLSGLFSCSRESIEDPIYSGYFLAPGDFVSVVMPDGSEFEIAFDGVDDRTWCYTVREVSGKSLSHWVLSLECHQGEDPGNAHIESIVPPDGMLVVNDTTTGVTGVKWETDDNFTEGQFCITMDDYYEPTGIEVAFKAGSDAGYGYVTGPSCDHIIIHDQGGGLN